MAHYRTTLHVPTSVEDTFDYLASFDTTAEWDPGVAEAHMTTPPPVAQGTRFMVVARFLGRKVPLEYEIVQFERPGSVVLQAQNGSVTSRDVITVEPGPDGTTSVTYDATLQARGLARIAEPLLALMFRKIGDAATDGLANTLQARAADQVP